MFEIEKFNSKIKGSGLVPGACRPLMVDKSYARIRNEKLGIRNGGAAHKIRSAAEFLKLAIFSYRKPNP